MIPNWQADAEELIVEHTRLADMLDRDAVDARKDCNYYVAGVLQGQADLCRRTVASFQVLLREVHVYAEEGY